MGGVTFICRMSTLCASETFDCPLCCDSWFDLLPVFFRKVSLSDNPLPKVIEQWNDASPHDSIHSAERLQRDRLQRNKKHVYEWCSLTADNQLTIDSWTKSFCRLRGGDNNGVNGVNGVLAFEWASLEALRGFDIFLQCCDFAFFTSTHNQIKHTYLHIRVYASFAVWCSFAFALFAFDNVLSRDDRGFDTTNPTLCSLSLSRFVHTALYENSKHGADALNLCSTVLKRRNYSSSSTCPCWSRTFSTNCFQHSIFCADFPAVLLS